MALASYETADTLLSAAVDAIQNAGGYAQILQAHGALRGLSLGLLKGDLIDSDQRDRAMMEGQAIYDDRIKALQPFFLE